MSYQRSQVNLSRLKERLNLVPSLEDFATHDATDMSFFEDQVIANVQPHFSRWESKQNDGPAITHCAKCIANGRLIPRHLQNHSCTAPFGIRMNLRHCVSFLGVDGLRGAHSRSKLQPVFVNVNGCDRKSSRDIRKGYC